MAIRYIPKVIMDDLDEIQKLFKLPSSLMRMDYSTIAKLRSENQWTPLHYAISRNRDKLILLMLENGADINAVTSLGSTPLHTACSYLNPNGAIILLQQKPNMNLQNQNLDTPLNIFVKWPVCFELLLRWFLDAGADPNIADRMGYAPLHTVATSHSSDVAVIYSRILLEYKANINSQNSNGKTPLHLAVEKRLDPLVQLLLENGASLNIKDERGETPIDVALRYRTEIPPILEYLGKRIIKEHCCKMKVNMKHLEELCKIESLKQFKVQCEEELLILKTRALGQSSITYYYILLSSPYEIGKYLRNSDISKSLRESDMNSYEFGDILTRKFQEGEKRFDALLIGYKFFGRNLQCMPHTCTDRIISYLNNEDLHSLSQFVSS